MVEKQSRLNWTEGSARFEDGRLCLFFPLRACTDSHHTNLLSGENEVKYDFSPQQIQFSWSPDGIADIHNFEFQRIHLL